MKDIENISLVYIFNDLIGEDIKIKINTDNIDSIVANRENIHKITDIIINNTPVKHLQLNETLKDIYYLYVYSYLLNNLNEVLKLKESEFLEKIYYPNLIYVLAFKFTKASKFFQLIIKNIYNESKQKFEKTLMFYITFYNSEFIVIKNDIINIFLNNMIFDMDPLEIEDFKSYYTSVFHYIFYLYLEKQTSGLIDQKIQITSGQEITLSSRYKIYKNGIRLTQIQDMCKESATLKKIYKNFDLIKTGVISNELQRLYSVLIDKNDIIDNKILILKFNMEDKRLTEIKQNFPLIFKLLRSIKIKSDTNFYSYYDKVLIRQSIRDSIYLKLKIYITEINASILADAISIKLENSITEGRYLDPYSLTILEIKGDNFLRQLSSFINMILDHIDTQQVEPLFVY